VTDAKSSEIALRTDKLWFAYREPEWALKDISLCIQGVN
jgi:hypothetical protein